MCADCRHSLIKDNEKCTIKKPKTVIKPLKKETIIENFCQKTKNVQLVEHTFFYFPRRNYVFLCFQR